MPATQVLGPLLRGVPEAPLPIDAPADVKRALLFSAVFTGVALIVFGAVKGRLTGVNPFNSGLQTLLVGGLAAGAAYSVLT